jgi:hypothetical protein
MAPPTLYQQPAPAGLMSCGPAADHPEISPRALLWTVAAVLAVVELVVEAT